MTTVAGSSEGHQDGQGTAAKLVGPDGVVCCRDGSAFVAETDAHVIRTVSAGGAVATFAGSGENAGFQDGQGPAARFHEPRQIARDTDGNLYVADSVNNRIRKVTPGGLVSTFAGTGGAGDKDGHCSEATFNRPWGIAVSPTTGNIIVGDTANHRIRVIMVRFNIVYTLAGGVDGFADGTLAGAQFCLPCHVACDGAGNVYIADQGNQRVRKITLANGESAVTTLAGDGGEGHRDGAGAQAQFKYPHGVAVDGGGNVLVTEFRGHRLRMVMPTGATSTLAGGGARGLADGQGTAARFSGPCGVAVDAAGGLLVADGDNHRVRHVAAGLTPPSSLRAPAPEAPTPKDLALANFGRLLDEGEGTYHDVEFVVGGETIRAHKNILSSQCEYFATMFGSGFAEGGAVADTTPAAFRALLRFLYTGTVDLKDESVLDVACLSQRYLVVNLQEQCFEHCRENVSPANAVPWLVLADTHKFGGLRATLLAYVAENRVEIGAAADTLDILRGHPELIYALFMAPAAKRRKTGN